MLLQYDEYKLVYVIYIYMKIIDKYIFKTYFSKLISVFIILMLIFIIQTFWLFIDEFAGKGLDFFIVSKFLIYYSPKLIPLVLLKILVAYTNPEDNLFGKSI